MKEFNVLVIFSFFSDNVNDNDIKRYSIYTFLKVHDGGKFGFKREKESEKISEIGSQLKASLGSSGWHPPSLYHWDTS